MSRYIDADALLNAINQNTAEAHNERCAQILEAILYTPTADVVEVKHGKWKQAYNSFPKYVCTNCNHLFNNKSFKYCPNCGAKMDGEVKGETK